MPATLALIASFDGRKSAGRPKPFAPPFAPPGRGHPRRRHRPADARPLTAVDDLVPALIRERADLRRELEMIRSSRGNRGSPPADPSEVGRGGSHRVRSAERGGKCFGLDLATTRWTCARTSLAGALARKPNLRARSCLTTREITRELVPVGFVVPGFGAESRQPEGNREPSTKPCWFVVS